MIPRHPTNELPRRARIGVPVTCQLFATLTAFLFTPVDGALAQQYPRELRHQEMITEIWMSGDDVAVSRRVPRNGFGRSQSDNEIARSMARMARQQSIATDQQRAKWLDEWAHKLSKGQIAANNLNQNHHPPKFDAEPRQERQPQSIAPNEVPRMDASTVAPSFAEPPLTLVPPFQPSTPLESIDTNAALAAAAPMENVAPAEQWPDAIVSDVSTGSGQTHLDIESELSAPADLIADAVRHPTEVAPESATDEFAAVAWTHPRLRTARIERQVASVEPLMDGAIAGLERAERRAAPSSQAESNREPTFVVFVSFTSGFVFCVGLVALIALTPRRRHHESAITKTHSSFETSEVERDGAAPTVDSDPTRGQVAAPHSMPFEQRSAVRQANVTPDKTRSLVEDFFATNVELLKQCA